MKDAATGVGHTGVRQLKTGQEARKGQGGNHMIVNTYLAHLCTNDQKPTQSTSTLEYLRVQLGSCSAGSFGFGMIVHAGY